jgi:succinate dehydrogenase/fumarate reductase flavoprotein subunit
MKRILSRREVIKGTATIGAASLLSLSFNGAEAIPPQTVPSWDDEADVVIVGFGGAGGNAAISAHDSGARVLIIEKMPSAGGNSAVSGAALLVPDHVPDAIRYYRALASGTVDEDLIRVFAEAMVGIPDLLKKLGIEFTVKKARPQFPSLPGSSTISKRIQFKPPGSGEVKFKALLDLVEKRRIKVIFNTAAKALIQIPETKEVVGIKADSAGKDKYIKANRGVVLTCGGYEYSQEMLAYFNLPGLSEFIFPWGSPGNTGDGVKMALGAGADLWHMCCLEWGPFCAKAPSKKFGFAVGAGLEEASAGSFIFVNKYGKRFMNERKSPVHRKGALEITRLDDERAEYPNLPSYMIFDETYRLKGPIVATQEFFELFFGGPVGYSMVHKVHEWSQDNAVEIEKEWIIRADTLKDLALKIKADPQGLEETVRKFKKSASTGEDLEFGRSKASMKPIETPPLYAVEIALSLINTQGGPKHNKHCQVLDPYGSPIPRLYAAGELGSFFGFLYQGGNNFQEAWAFGRLAGKNAASETPLK